VHLGEEPFYDNVFLLGLIVFEIILSRLVVLNVSYTEIDWEAYMEEVETWWVDGEHDYRNIRGGTGPLVYPAGFLYLFLAARGLTSNGTDVRQAQNIFLGFYVATQLVVLLLYQQTVRFLRQQQTTKSTKDSDDTNFALAHEIWSWRIAMALTCLSKRGHSIFLLRLFNDGPTMMFFYVAALLFVKQRWNTGCVVFSLAVTQKMNVLLFAPGLLLLLLQVGPDLKTVIRRLLLCCALPQLLLGAPFLFRHPVSYLRKAFELDRVFFYKWTVNWKVRLLRLWWKGVVIRYGYRLTICSFFHTVLTRRCVLIKVSVDTSAALAYRRSRGLCFSMDKGHKEGHRRTVPLSRAAASLTHLRHFNVARVQLYRHVLCANDSLSVLCLVLARAAVSALVQWHPQSASTGYQYRLVGRDRKFVSNVSSNTCEFGRPPVGASRHFATVTSSKGRCCRAGATAAQSRIRECSKKLFLNFKYAFYISEFGFSCPVH
jgi:hypothetical protein